MSTMSAKTRHHLNEVFCEMGKVYWETWPMPKFMALLKAEGFTLFPTYKEEYTPGHEGNALLALADASGVEVENAALSFSWYLMPSKRWEIVAYIS